MAEAETTGQEKVQNPSVEEIVTALCEWVNHIQIDFAQMYKLHTDSITGLNDLAKKVEAKLPDPLVQPYNSSQQIHNVNPTGGHGGGKVRILRSKSYCRQPAMLCRSRI